MRPEQCGMTKAAAAAQTLSPPPLSILSPASVPPCRPEQCGMTKTDAAAQTLSGINPDVKLESYTMNITTVQGFERFKVGEEDGGKGEMMAPPCHAGV